MELSLKDVNRILEYQQEYFHTDATRCLDFRIKQLKALKSGMKKHEKALLLALEKDLGKHKNEGYICEIGIVYKSIAYAIKNLKKWAKLEKVPTPIYLKPGKSYIVNEPYGTVLILGTFNYPVQLILEPLIGAIAAGNTVVVKTSEMAANTSKALRQMLEDIFRKRHVMCVEGGVETAEALVNSQFDYIFYTGSTAVGKSVMTAAAKNLVPVTLELGGKCSAIVHKDANIKEAARRIVWGKTLNAGQTCVAPDYVMAHESIADELTLQMEKAIKKYYGDHIEKNHNYGRIINQKHFDRLMALMEGERTHIFCGGGSNEQEKYIEPTIINLKSSDSPLMREEIFGPLLPILRYEDEQQVVQLVRSLPISLAIYIFTKNNNWKKQMMLKLPSGNVCINDTILHMGNYNLPFGGVGGSGMGHYHGYSSFETFSHRKGVLDKNSRITNTLIYPPYTKGKLKIIKTFLK